jgi:hypothetical protein
MPQDEWKLGPRAEDERYPIRIARDGTWYHEGAPIRRAALVRLFATVLSRDANGDYWLRTPAERGRITVEDAPFLAVEVQAEGEGRDRVLRFRTNLDEWVEAGPARPIRVAIAPETGEPAPYVMVRDGLEARIARSVYYDLVGMGEERAGEERAGETAREFGIWSDGQFFVLGSV